MDINDLKTAVREVARANADHDATRADLIKRADGLKATDLLPDNWNADGSLKDTAMAWSSDEERETYGDISCALEGAIEDAVDAYYTWVKDFTDTEVIFYANEGLWSVAYTLEPGGAVTLDGEPVKVRPVTTYVPRSDNTDLERRKRKAEDIKGTLERRHFDFESSNLEVRESGDGSLTLTGYASVTETAYEVGFYTERIQRGAFKGTLRDDPDVQLLVNHEGLPLARTKSGTLRLSENDRGLFVEADLDPEDSDVQSLVRKMNRGDIDQMSFAFQVRDQDWNDDYTERTIKSVSIHRGDVSVVNQAANPAATASVRGLALALETRAGRPLTAEETKAVTDYLRHVADGDEAELPELGEQRSVKEELPEKPATRVSVLQDFTTRAAQELELLKMGAR